MMNGDEVWSHVEAVAQDFRELSDRIWGMPELNYEERRSAAEHMAMLQKHGFRAAGGIAGIPTAVMGEAGEDGPVIAILGEYDALPAACAITAARRKKAGRPRASWFERAPSTTSTSRSPGTPPRSPG